MKWYVIALLWLTVGYGLDRMCEWEAKHRKQPYNQTIAWLCYLAGPVLMVFFSLAHIAKLVRKK